MHRIKQAEKQEKRLILALYTLIFVIGGILLLVFFTKNIIMVIFGLCVTILGSFLFLKQFRSYFKEQFPLSEMLENEPEKIVWVYSMVTQRMPFGFQINETGTMHFKLVDGKEIILSLSADELKSVSEMLNSKLPHATFGYTKEREQWYIAHPELLIRDEDKE